MDFLNLWFNILYVLSLAGGPINRFYIWLDANPQHNPVEPYIVFDLLYILSLCAVNFIMNEWMNEENLEERLRETKIKSKTITDFLWKTRMMFDVTSVL